MARFFAGLLLEARELGLGVLEPLEALVQGDLLDGGALAQAVGPLAGRLGDLVHRGEIRLVPGDLLGEGLVLLADVDEVAHLGQQVAERPAREERLEQRCPVAVVRAPDALGQQRLALAQLGPLLVLLRLEAGQLHVEHLQLEHQVVVGLLDDLDPAGHPGDLRLDRRQVGVDAGELVPRRGDIRGQARLQGVELGDLGLLELDLLLHLGGPRPGVRQLVAAGRRRQRRRAEQPEDEGEHEGEGGDPAPGRPATRGRRRPAGCDRVRRSIGLAAFHVGDVIVRADSVGRPPCLTTGATSDGYARRSINRPDRALDRTTPAPGHDTPRSLVGRRRSASVTMVPPSVGPRDCGYRARVERGAPAIQPRNRTAQNAPMMKNGPNGT